PSSNRRRVSDEQTARTLAHVGIYDLACNEGALHESKESEVETLWWSGHRSMRAMVQLLCGVLCRYGVKADKGVRLQLREAVLAAETVYTGNRQSVGFHDHMVRENTTYDPVHHFAHLNTAPVAAALGGRDQWFDMRPFIVGQVTQDIAICCGR